MTLASPLPGTTPIPDRLPPAVTGHYHTERSGVIRCTDTAVTFELGDSFAVFPYSSISAVSGGRGLMFGSITLTVDGQRERLTWIDPNDATPELVRHIAKRIARNARS